MPDQSVDRSAIAVWRWGAAATSVFALLGCTAFALISRSSMHYLFPLLLLLAAVLAVFVAWYPAARYRHLAYDVDETGITIREGIFWRTQSSLARVRIQHTDVSQGPLQRHYGIATLKLYTAGSHFTKTELPGLSHAAAIALRDELQREGDTDAV